MGTMILKQGANKMKKLIILIPMLLILCGCTAEVNIELDDMMLKENISIDAYPDEYYQKDQLKSAFRNYIPVYNDITIVDTMPDEKVSGVQYYNRSEKDLQNGYRFIYNYNFNLEKYKDARSLKGAFKSSTIQYNKKDKEILISTDKNKILYFNEYPSLTRIKVNIKTPYPVKESNADSISGNIYSWNFDKNTSKNIYLLLDSEKKTTTKEEQDKTEKNPLKKPNTEKKDVISDFLNEHPLLVVIASIILFIIVVSIISKITKNKY